MTMHHLHFTEPCCKAFRFLSERYGFTEPEVETIGRESFVRFKRDYQTVSIAYEPGCPPIVELFYPCSEKGEPPVPWAKKDGIQRTRRIPRLNLEESFVESNLDSIRRYLNSSARALEEVENKWLAT